MNRLALAVVASLSCAAFAQNVPSQLSFSARVANAGVPLTGSHTLNVRLFDTATGGAELWTETSQTTAEGGLVTATLGAQMPLGPSLLDGRALFMEVSVDGQVLLPRLPVVSVPYAVRASVAATAGTLGNLSPADLALVGHNHSGVYLPVSASSSCSGTDKMIGINASGSVACSPDLNSSVTFAGTGTATTASRSDHTHAYLPLGSTLACTGTNKVSGLNANGSVTCTPDADTLYTVSSGLQRSGNQFSVEYAGFGALYGSAASVARSDHPHTFDCPAGYGSHFFGGGTPEGTTVLCSKAVTSAAITWAAAARSCASNNGGGSLCTFNQLTTARISNFASVPQALFLNFWMGDRTGDNMALYSNGVAGDDFDAVADTSTTTMVGFYCCTTGTFFR